MVHTRGEVIRTMTGDFLDRLDPQNLPPPDAIQEGVLASVEMALKTENSLRDRGDKFRYVHELLPAQLAMILLRFYPIVRIGSDKTKDTENRDVLAIYQDSGPDEGTYTTDLTCFHSLIRTYSFTATQRVCEETIAILINDAPRVTPCRDRGLIAVNNGIYDYERKQLLPFTPEKIFLSKCKVDYNPNAQNITIIEPDGAPWDVESWMNELSDDPEIVELLWCIIGAIIRPNVPWGKSAFLYATTGNNGKGTLCELMRQICGEGTYTSIPLADFGRDFMLEPLIGVSAVIVDENDVGTFVDKGANLKAVITNDVVLINRKHAKPIAIQPQCFMVQCCNELPRFRDKSSSLTRRIIIVPFTKSFTGCEKKYIKNDYLHRQDVLEYVLRKVLELMPDYYELPEPEACKAALNEYREYNNPVQSFLTETLPLLVWDLVPWGFLYDLYKAWFQQANPSGSIQGRNTFVNDVKALLGAWPEWQLTNPRDGMRTGNRMSEPEPLIHEYNLTNWMNPYYDKSSNIDAKCTPLNLKDKYIGMFRISNTVSTTDTE